MTLSLTLFSWVALYASTSRRLKVAVSDRVRIVSVVPSSMADISVEGGTWAGRWHAVIATSTTAAIATRHRPRPREMAVGIDALHNSVSVNIWGSAWVLAMS